MVSLDPSLSKHRAPSSLELQFCAKKEHVPISQGAQSPLGMVGCLQGLESILDGTGVPRGAQTFVHHREAGPEFAGVRVPE